ncbi:MAG: undecaprenyl-diphosphate phosphatase [Candidatus Bathyarchaeota archaeon]|nr:undecaprenyl-diphosphate phosphatase [Candidatus Bathyarchaeota archaeon]MDH5663640.1 undecaprenyl-diphosphate phosphatase [Candidatus Bathyarchaeota archaeon]
MLAVVQGITEWLPISSFGHLVIVEEYLGLEPPLIFNVMLHVGTLFVVLVVFRRDIMKIIKALVRLDFKTDEGKLALFIAVGSVPTALIGFFFHDIFESFSHNLLAVGVALLITGFVLFVSERRKTDRELSYLDSLLIGTAQGIAITPGISRSGVTIATGLLRRVKKEIAFKYSFLLSVPAVIGATAMGSRDLVVGNVDVVALFLGAITSMMVGYISLKFLQKIVMKEKFHLFAYYCWIVGLITVFFHFF